MLTKEETEFVEAQQKELDTAKSNSNIINANMQQQSLAIQQQEKSMIKEQLDLSNEIMAIKHLLQGDTLSEEDGNAYWEKATDPSLVILTEYGVNYLVQFITYYSTKNTLLSNYDEDTILKKMEDIALTLADRIFMNYEKFFKYPTFEECKAIFMNRIERKTELREFALDLAHIKNSKEDIRQVFVKEREPIIEKEMEKIKEQIMKDKLKAFESILRVVQDFIHSSYNRAYAGQERKTLRQHIHISENRNPTMPTKKPSKMNILNYGQ